MPRYYVHDLESDKLHIYTGGKADWLTIPEADRDAIKSACLWSKSRSCWVSRAKGGTMRFWSLEALKRNGFEDRGTQGERLTFAEQVEAKQERAEERAERFEGRSEAAQTKSASLHQTWHNMMDAIPFGQPILVGHHSEQRDRNYRERANNKIAQAVDASNKADYYAGRAATARATAGGAQYSDPGYLSRRIKEVNAEIGILTRYLSGSRFGTAAAERMHLAGSDATEATTRTVTDEDRERWTRLLEQEQDKLGFFQHCLETCGKVVYNRETLKGKTQVLVRGGWQEIVRLNPTTVAVPNICFPLPEHQRKYAFKYLYGEVKDAR